MLKSFRIECADWTCYFETSRQLIPTKGCRISKTHLMNVSSVLSKIRMLFRELWSLRAPVWTSCLRYWGDLLWITLCTKIHLLHRKSSFKGTGPYKVCPPPVSIGEAAQRTLTARLCTDLFFDMYITAPYTTEQNRTEQNLYCLWITHRFALRLHKIYQ